MDPVLTQKVFESSQILSVAFRWMNTAQRSPRMSVCNLLSSTVHGFSIKKDGELQVRLFSLPIFSIFHREEQVTRRGCRVNQQHVLTAVPGFSSKTLCIIQSTDSHALLLEKGKQGMCHSAAATAQLCHQISTRMVCFYAFKTPICLCLVFNHGKNMEYENLELWRFSYLEIWKRWQKVTTAPAHQNQRCCPWTRGSLAHNSSETSPGTRVTAFKSHMGKQLKLSEEFTI